MRAWLLSCFLMAGPALAQESETSNPVAPVDPLSSGYLLKVTLGMVFIIVLIFVLAWMAKKMQLAPAAGHQLIKVLAAVSVGNRDRIALVEVGGEQILLGVSPGRINKLHVLSTPVSVEDKPGLQSPFAAKLAKMLEKSSSVTAKNTKKHASEEANHAS